jgi:AcrR family transcriptional regulator
MPSASQPPKPTRATRTDGPAKPRRRSKPETPPDPGTREKLLRTGLRLAREVGIKRMSVRAVAAAAEVNLGSFVYHFGTREAFVLELMERWYAPLFSSLELTAAGRDADPLRQALRQLALWAAENGRFLAMLLRDAASGEGGVQRFLSTMDKRHIAVVLRLIVQGQHQGRLRQAEPTLLLMFLIGSLVLPILMTQGLKGLGPKAFVARLAQLAADEQAIEQRLDWALRGLVP